MPTAPSRSCASRLHRRPLAVCLAAILAAPAALAVSANATPATTLTVTNCADSGAGSLRDTIAAAVSGDTIGFDLACSHITLTSGAIVIGQGGDGQPITTLEIIGPGRNSLTIDGYYLDRVLEHEGGAGGSLTISGLALKHGFTGGSGGCLFAQGDVSLTDVEVVECAAGFSTGIDTPLGGGIRGGGIYAGGSASLTSAFVGDNMVNGHNSYAYGAGLSAGGNVSLTSTTISGNFATSDTGATFGGGVAVGYRSGSVQGSLQVFMSSIENNTATSHCGYCPVRGGGAWVYGSSTFDSSTITGNAAFSDAQYGAGGGLYFSSRYGGAPVTATLTGTDAGSNFADENAGAIGAGGDLTIIGGTISGNNSNLSGGAIGLFGGNLDLVDSLMTGNIASDRGGAIFLFGYGDVAAENSTISENMAGTNGGAIANTYGSVHLSNTTLTANTAGSSGGGIWFRYAYYTLSLESTIVAGNTVGSNADDIFAPGNTVAGSHDLVVAAPGVDLPGDTISSDPMLMPLADNGGPTLTHALSDGSPAIDAGSNPLALDHDQRGDGFARVSGAAADIGAFEVQSTTPDDRIFADGFDP